MEDKSYIDPRVARGRAKQLSAGISARSSADVFIALLTRESSRWRRGMTGREAYKYMQHVEQLLIRREVISYGLGRGVGQTVFRGFYEQSRSDGGVDVIYLEYSSTLPPSMAVALPVEVTAHALQRAIQRIGSMDSARIRQQLLRAFTTFPLIRICVEQDGWRQFGLVTEEGIFVGGLDDGAYRVRTFIAATENGRPSAWRDIHSLLWQCYSDSSRSEANDEPAPAVPFDDLLYGLAKRYPFLLKTYEPKNDPLNEVWASRPR